MAKIKIYFDNENYQIDESSFSDASSKLQSHLSNVMNGSGATIKFGGTSYNVDSTKLQNATNDFTSHLGTIAGNGRKVIVNGIEYSIDSEKVQGAVAELKAIFGNLNSGDEPLIGEAYAIYDETNQGLYFVRSETPITQGATFTASNGTEISVTNVFTGFETGTYEVYLDTTGGKYTYISTTPWNSISSKVNSVKVIDEIKPISTAAWFNRFEYCQQLDVSKINTSESTNMSNMFEFVGNKVSSSFRTEEIYDGLYDETYTENIAVEIIGLNKWDTSKVENMNQIFTGIGQNANGCVFMSDISGWNVSNVTNMNGLLCGTGTIYFDDGYVIYDDGYVYDLSAWDVSKVTTGSSINYSGPNLKLPAIWN